MIISTHLSTYQPEHIPLHLFYHIKPESRKRKKAAMPENKNLMDTEPGGEQTQYEGQNTFVQGHSKEEGQFNGSFFSSQFHIHVPP